MFDQLFFSMLQIRIKMWLTIVLTLRFHTTMFLPPQRLWNILLKILTFFLVPWYKFKGLLRKKCFPVLQILCMFTVLQLYLQYVEIKCQLDATEIFIADLIACWTCFGHHYAHHQELKSIIQWLLPVVFGAVVFNLLVWCGAEGYVSGLQDAAASCKPAVEL